jgi:DNA-binding MarR family transcriptional regulator
LSGIRQMARVKSERRSGVAVLERSPSQLLHRAQQMALDIYAQEFGAGAITQRQFALLAAVADNEGANQSDLVRITGIDRSTLADMAVRMIAKGLLARERSETDARANAVKLTSQGKRVLEDARPKMAKADQRLLKLMADGRRQTLVALLREVIKGGEAAERKQAEAAQAAAKPRAPVRKRKPAAKPKAKAKAKR